MNKKYIMPKKTTVVIILIAVVLLIVYAGIIYTEGLSENTILVSNVEKDINAANDWLFWADILKNVVLVLFSVFASSLISMLVIEKNNSNTIYYETLINEVVMNESMLKLANEKSKEELFNKLESIKLKGCPNTKVEMINSLRNKMVELKDSYYFTSCDYIVDCSINNNYIEKNITRTTLIRSYEKNKKIDNFVFASSALEKSDDFKHLEIKEIKINDEQTLKENIDYKIVMEKTDNLFHKKGGYDIKCKCVFLRKLTLASDKDYKICIRYITRVKPTDITYNCRVSQHCKKFSLHFKITNNDEYKIFAEPFGFLENASKTPNSTSKNDVRVDFDDWIFKRDGVAITLNKM